MVGMAEISAEDKKLVTLARATRARIGAAEGAAARDTDGRTYAAATVELPSLQLSAVQACIAMAVASGSAGIDAIVVLGESGELASLDRAPLAARTRNRLVVCFANRTGSPGGMAV